MTAPSRTDSSTRHPQTCHEPWQAKVVHDGTTVTADAWRDGGTGAWRWRVHAGDLPVAWGVSPDKDKAQAAATSAAERHLECPVHLLSTAEASP